MTAWIEQTGLWAPAFFAALFVVSTLLIIGSLHLMESRGLQGGALGILFTPYCTGLGNLIFVGLMVQEKDGGQLVLENVLVNNMSNLTLLIGFPALLWGMNMLGANGKSSASKRRGAGMDEPGRINRLSLLLSLFAVVFFSSMTWVLGLDGSLDQRDGIVLVGLFVFWQVFHIHDVSKTAEAGDKGVGAAILIDIGLLLAGGYLTYISIQWLVGWVMVLGDGFFGRGGLGWLGGWLMVLPNAMMVAYYAARGRADIAYSSQIGSCHIGIPLCVGLFAMFQPVDMPAAFVTGIWLMLGVAFLHLTFIFSAGRLPRWAGAVLTMAYGYFIYYHLVIG